MKKKILTGMIGATLIFSFAGPAWAQTNESKDEISSELTVLSTEQKFNFLKEKGIFTGKADGHSHLEDQMTRAQLAAVLYRLYPLAIPKIYKDPFDDVTTKYWAWEAIFAVTNAGLMNDKDGKFNPNGNVTLEELAAAAVKALELNPDDYASIWLPGSDWAQGYLAAALTEGILEKADNYKAIATRADLVKVIYAVYQKEQERNGIVAGDLVPTLSYEKMNNGSYQFTFTVKNQTEQEQILGLSGQKFDYILYKDGEKLEQYSDGRNFIMIYEEITLKQGEEYTVGHTFENLKPGQYKNDWLADSNWPNAKATTEFKVE